jgi:uncharacterized GH25 family protein
VFLEGDAMRVAPGQWVSTRIPWWLFADLALLSLSPQTSRACLDLGEQAQKAGETKNEPRRVALRLVAHADQHPLPGAIVKVVSYRYPNGWWGDPLPAEPERLTDQQGRCLIEVSHAVSGLGICAAKDGFAPVTQSVVWEGDTVFQYLSAKGWTLLELRRDSVPTVTKELESGEPIGGLVTNDQGHAIEGAEVTVAFDHSTETPDLDLLTPSNWSADGDFPYVRVKTDAQGRWRCSSLPAGSGGRNALLLRVVHPDYVSDTGGFKRQLSFGTARAMKGTLTMKRGASVSGEVRDGEGQSIPGARVVLAYSNHPTDFLGVKTDATGRFVFPHVDLRATMSRWVVEVEATGFAPASKAISPGSNRLPLEFRLSRGRPFHGRVVDNRGRPVAGIEVRPRWAYLDHLDWRTVSDADGRFTWPDAPREGDYAFDLQKGGALPVYAPVSAMTDWANLTFDPK